MTFRAPPKPTEERARATEDLIRAGGTDTARWAQMNSLATQWDSRAVMAAEWIPDGSSVLDVGAGAMALGSVLKPHCTYQPADVVERRPGCFVVDLNRGEFPPGQYDWVTFLGVLEYVHDIDAALRRALGAAPRMIVTYCTYIPGSDVGIRRGMGWVNEFAAPAFTAALERTGWRVERSREVKRGPGNIQMMFECARAT
jgi:hypothetical protein